MRITKLLELIRYMSLPIIYQGECRGIPDGEWEKICEMAGEADE